MKLFNFIFVFLTFCNFAFSQGIVTYTSKIGDTSNLVDLSRDFGFTQELRIGVNPPEIAYKDEFKGVVFSNTSQYPVQVYFEVYSEFYWDWIIKGNSGTMHGAKYKFTIMPFSRLYVNSQNQNIIKIYKWTFMDFVNIPNHKSMSLPNDRKFITDPYYFIFQNARMYTMFYSKLIIRA